MVHGTETIQRYDQYGQLIEETLANGLKLTYKYDYLGRVIDVGLPDGSNFIYRYDACYMKAIDRIINGKACYTHKYNAYDLSGNVLSQTLIEKAGTVDYQYDLLNRTIKTIHPHWQETVPDQGYDAVGNLLYRSYVDPQGSVNCAYTYDDLYQIKSENGAFSHTYRHDSLQNRIAKDEQLYRINALNQLLEQTDTKYEYDRNGNLLFKRQENDLTSYRYDALDRLIEVNDGVNLTQYYYDSSHRRICKVLNGSREDYLYQGKNEIGAVRNGKIVQLRMLGLSRGAEVGATVVVELEGEVYASLHDPYGNFVVLLDKKGNVVETYRYSAFGET